MTEHTASSPVKRLPEPARKEPRGEDEQAKEEIDPDEEEENYPSDLSIDFEESSAAVSPNKRSRKDTTVINNVTASRGAKLRGLGSFEEEGEEGEFGGAMDGGSEDLDSSELGSEDEPSPERTKAKALESSKCFSLSTKGSKRRIRKKKAAAQEEEEKTTATDFTISGRFAESLVSNPLSSSLLKKNGRKMPSSVNKPHSEIILMLRSVYEGRPPTVFF